MKKILLATALAAVSLSAVSAEATTAGKGFYIGGALGGSLNSVKAEDTASIYLLEDGAYVKKDAKERQNIMGFASSLFWGYSHRFDSNMTLGFEAEKVVTPTLRFGYMFAGSHHVALGINYDWLTSAVSGILLDSATKDWPSTDKEKLKLDFKGISGLGLALSYEYFTQSKNFVRLQLSGNYFDIEGKAGKTDFKKDAMVPNFALDGKASGIRYELKVGFGSQW